MNISTPRTSRISRLLQPGEEVILDALGTFYYVAEAEGAIAVGMGDDTPTPADVGTGYKGIEGEGFRALRVQNLSTLTNKIVIVVGFGDYRDNRFTLVPSRDFALRTMHAPTRVKGWATSSIPATSGVIFDGVFAKPDIIRKALTISNEASGGLKVQVRDPDGNVILVINDGDSAYLETSGEVEIYNPNGGGAIQVRVGEIIYTNTAV